MHYYKKDTIYSRVHDRPIQSCNHCDFRFDLW